METVATHRRKATTVRLPESMLADLQATAKQYGISVSSLIESIAEEAMYHQPNDLTLSAIDETQAGKYGGTVDTSSIEAFKRSMGL